MALLNGKLFSQAVYTSLYSNQKKNEFQQIYFLVCI